MRCPRFFLDTNVLVSAVLFGGTPAQLVDAARDGVAEGVVSLHVLSEFVDVLTRPRFGVDEATAVMLAEEIASFAEVVPVTVASGAWVSDIDDDPVVEAALLGRATHLVTGDARILEVLVEGIRMVTPAQAARELNTRRGGDSALVPPEVISCLVDCFDPLQIILFGSRARGDSDDGSDFDLLVVLPEVTDKHATAVAMLVALGHLAVPVDVIPADAAEIAAHSGSSAAGTALAAALREGEVVYERVA